MFVKAVKSRKGKKSTPSVAMAKGTYEIRFDEIAQQWLESVDDERGMLMWTRNDQARVSNRAGGVVLGADFEFGIFEDGIAQFWVDGEGRHEDYDKADGYSSDVDSWFDGQDEEEEDEDENDEDEDDGEGCHYARSRLYGQARKCQKKTVLPAVPEKPKKKANLNTRILHFKWRARETGEGELQYSDDQTGTIEFTDDTFYCVSWKVDGELCWA